MGSKKKEKRFEQNRSGTKPGEDLSAREFENHLADLYVAMRAQPLHAQTMTHEEVQELLPSYLDIEASVENAQKIYPLIEEHLQTCAQCGAMYNRLKSALEIFAPQPRALNLPILSAKDISETQTPALRIIQTPATGRAFGNIQFLISPPRTNQTTLFVMRSAMPIQESLLFSAQVTLDKHPLLVQAWHSPAVIKNHAMVRVELVASPSIARGAIATLDWGEIHLDRKFSRGESIFNKIAATDSPISITLEFPAYARPRPHPPSRPTPRASKRATKTRAKEV